MTSKIKFGVVTVSDRASRGEYQDRGGPALRDCFTEFVSSEFEMVQRVIPDEMDLIEKTFIELSDDEQCCLIVSTGGTGPALRDVTVEATLNVIHKPMPGFGELMRKVSLEKVPTAILSRQEAGIRFKGDRGALLVNLPGSPKAIRECLIAVFPAIPYCVDLIGGPYIETHEDVVSAFRPKSAKRKTP